MNYILVASPDKVSLGGCMKFLRTSLGPTYPIGEMHSLMSEESLSMYLDQFCQMHPKALLTYYAKGVKPSETPGDKIPKKLIDKADVIIWFDLYSTIMQVIKDPEGFMPNLVEEWNKYIQRIS